MTYTKFDNFDEMIKKYSKEKEQLRIDFIDKMNDFSLK